MKTGTSSLMDGKDYQQRKVMRIDDVNAMADANMRENEINKLKETLYTEAEVLQLLLRLQQTESYDNLYDFFKQFKK